VASCEEFGGLIGLVGLSAGALADLTPPAFDVLSYPSCRGASADIEVCSRAIDDGDDDKAIELCSKGLRSEHLSKIDRASGHNDRDIAYDNKG
jgi:hypothetical protein